MTRDEELYVESLREDLKRAAALIDRVEHSGICPCECCRLNCPVAGDWGDGHADGCDVGSFLRRIETT